MGNQALVPSQIQSVESYFYDLKNLFEFKSSLGSTTFIKTAKISNHCFSIDSEQTLISLDTLLQQVDSDKQHLRLNQQLVVKIFPKYDVSIRHDLYANRIQEIKNIIYKQYNQFTNCLPFNKLLITNKAAYLFRQYVKFNLYDRLSTHPFLNDVEKKWLTFQLMSAVNECHSLKIIHGDIKTENVLVNSFLWLSLSDFASYKPAYLSSNHPSADFNYFFDTSRRRTCYLAPERFDGAAMRQNDSSSDELRTTSVDNFTFEMDIFSLGCTIGELFLERPLFDFARLLAYREHKYDPSVELKNEIKDENIVQMILSMIQLESSERKSIDIYLQEQNNKSFPSFFVNLKRYVSKFLSNDLSADNVVLKLKEDLPMLLKNFHLDCDSRENQTNDAFLILLSLLLSTIRQLKFAKNKLISIEILLKFCNYLHDSIILDRVLPYLIYLLESKQAAIVKASCINALNDLLNSISEIDQQNVNIFQEIIFDTLLVLSRDESYLVRATVARTIASFAQISMKFLDQKLMEDRTLRYMPDDHVVIVSPRKLTTDENAYDKKIAMNQTKVIEILMNLLNDVSYVSSNAIREALLRSNFDALCSYFGRQKTSEFLLPHMITILNEITDWHVRAAFFDALSIVLGCLGWESIELARPLIEQGFKDSEEFVIHRTLSSISCMVEMGLFDRQHTIDLLNTHVASLLCHPSLWIRHGTVRFISLICTQAYLNGDSNNHLLNTADILCSVLPAIDKFLQKNDLIEYGREEILFYCLKKPLERGIYDCVLHDGRSDVLFNHLAERSEQRSLTTENFRPCYVDCQDMAIQRLFSRLQANGLTEDDEEKLLSMKEFMEKTRKSKLSSSLHGIESMNTNISLSMQYLKDSYSLKDGCILLMRDRFPYLHSEMLSVSVSRASVTPNEMFENDDTMQKRVNVEWKMMFTSSALPTNQSLDKLKEHTQLALINLKKRSPTQTSKSSNCISEFDDYLNKCELHYEGNRIQKAKLMRSSETINASTTSNFISLSTNAMNWRPKGHLLVHSNEHVKSIDKMCKNTDSSYFATLSSDESCIKIWSTDSLYGGNAGYFRSKLTYRFSNENITRTPTCMTFSDHNSLTVICDDFSLFKINFDSVKGKYQVHPDAKLLVQCAASVPSKSTFYAKSPVSGDTYKSLGSNTYPTELIYLHDSGLYCYASSTGHISCVDLRTKTKAFDLKCDLRKGYVTSMITDPWNTWLAAGTSNGFIEVYDFRFMIPLEEFTHRSKASVVKLANHPSLKSHICASYRGNNEISIWNIDDSSQMKANMLQSRNFYSPEFTFWGVNSPPLCSEMTNVTSNKFISGMYGVNLAGDSQNAGYLVCASTDMKIRCIDLNESCSINSYVISSPTNLNMQIHQRSSKDAYHNQTISSSSAPAHYEMRQIEGSKVLVEVEPSSLNGHAQSTFVNSHAIAFQSCSTPHQDSITDLLLIYKNSSNQPFLVTSSRDGNFKVWR